MASCSNSAPKKAKVESSRTKPNWLDLPTDVTILVLQKLDALTIIAGVRNVCSLWRNICKDPHIWRTIHVIVRYANWWRTTEILYMNNLARYAIDQSCCGLLEKAHITNADAHLLIYMADRATNLRRLRLEECFQITDEELIKVANKLPLLEELDISIPIINKLSKYSLEAIGKCCPLLNSLVFSRSKEECLSRNDYVPSFLANNGEAFAIANTMPNLRRLHIVGNRLTISGFNAIIDGCPHLESLDLRGCRHLTIGQLQKQKCQERIKDLRLPTNKPYSECSVFRSNKSDINPRLFLLPRPLQLIRSSLRPYARK